MRPQFSDLMMNNERIAPAVNHLCTREDITPEIDYVNFFNRRKIRLCEIQARCAT